MKMISGCAAPRSEIQPTSAKLGIPISEVATLIGYGRSSIYSMMKPGSKNYDPTFPGPVRIGIRRSVWFEAEVRQWLLARSRVHVQGSGSPDKKELAS